MSRATRLNPSLNRSDAITSASPTFTGTVTVPSPANDNSAIALGLADAAYAYYGNVRDQRYAGGAKGDAQTYVGMAASTGAATTVTVSPGIFTPQMVGKTLLLPGAGPSGTQLATTITARASLTSITIADLVSTTVSGATGVVVTDDTAAIDAARAARRAVFFPPGGYFYSGTGLEADHLACWGAGSEATYVWLGTNDALVASANTVSSMALRHIKVIGGYGAVRLASTAYSVGSHLTVEHCAFEDYTGCAISSLSGDQPYWMIRVNTFDAVNNGAGTFGISLNGDNSGSSIDKNQFLNNGCHIRLGGTGGAAVKVTNNDFIRIGPYTTAPRIDLWLTAPNPRQISAGLYVSGNKHGSENSDSRDFRVLVADEDASSGTNAADRRPRLGTASPLTFNNALFTGNLWAGESAAGTSAYLTLATTTAQGNRIRDLGLAGTVAANVIKYLFPPDDTAQSATNAVGPFLSPDLSVTGDWSGFSVCNYPGSWDVVDDTGVLQEPSAALVHPGAGDAATYLALSTRSVPAFSTSGTATITGISDRAGGSDAATIAMPAPGDAVTSAFSNASLIPGSPVYIEFDARQGGGSPVAGFEVLVRGPGGTRWARRIAIGTEWARYRFEWVPRAGTDANALGFGAAGGTGTGAFQIGRVRMYHAQEPINVDGLMVALNTLGPAIVAGPGKTLGFYGATGTVRPTVSGSKGGNAALGSLITALASLGILTDATS